MKLSQTEHAYSATIHAKLQELRAFLTDTALDPAAHPANAYLDKLTKSSADVKFLNF